MPQTWTHLLTEAAGQPVNPMAQTPDRWREYVARRTGLTAPEQITEGTPAVFEPFESGCNPADPVDRAIMATRNAVFPLHGLMPPVTSSPDERPRTRCHRAPYPDRAVSNGQPRSLKTNAMMMTGMSTRQAGCPAGLGGAKADVRRDLGADQQAASQPGQRPAKQT
jgi:hypothetical protein